MQELQVNFDLERMRESINSGTVTFPRGLGKARRQFMRDDNQTFPPIPVEQYNASECIRGILCG